MPRGRYGEYSVGREQKQRGTLSIPFVYGGSAGIKDVG
jgi:hypothetical protein